MSWRTWRFGPLYEGSVCCGAKWQSLPDGAIYPSKSKKPPFFLNRLVIGNELFNHRVLLRKDFIIIPKQRSPFFVLKNTEKWRRVEFEKFISTQTPLVLWSFALAALHCSAARRSPRLPLSTLDPKPSSCGAGGIPGQVFVPKKKNVKNWWDFSNT